VPGIIFIGEKFSLFTALGLVSKDDSVKEYY